MSMQLPKLGIYTHYKSKDKFYELIAIGRATENAYEEVAIYKAMYDIPELGGEGVVFVRPLKMFMENVVVDGKGVPRFEYVGEV